MVCAITEETLSTTRTVYILYYIEHLELFAVNRSRKLTQSCGDGTNSSGSGGPLLNSYGVLLSKENCTMSVH